MSTLENLDEQQLFISDNKEEWNRLLSLLSHTEDPSVFWINTDTTYARLIISDIIAKDLSEFSLVDVSINSETSSLFHTIRQCCINVDNHTILSVTGLSEALENSDFLRNLNMEREELFRQVPAHILIWGDAAAVTRLHRHAYDFWSWLVYIFNFHTPMIILNARQKEFQTTLLLSDGELIIPGKEADERIRHLKTEWDDFLSSIGSYPKNSRQLSDLVIIGIALSDSYQEDGRYESALQVLETIKNFDDALFFRKDLMHLYSRLGIINAELGIYGTSLDIHKKALAIAENLHDENHRDFAVVYNNIGIVYRKLDDLDNALISYEKALHINISIFGNTHSTVATCYNNIGIVYECKNDLDKSLQSYKNALLIYQQVDDAKQLAIATTYNNLGNIYVKRGELDSALESYKTALKLRMDMYGQTHPSIASLLGNMGNAQWVIGNKEEAINYANQAYYIFKEYFNDNHPNTIKAKYNLDFFSSND